MTFTTDNRWSAGGVKNYIIEWDESVRYRVRIQAPSAEEAREVFWWHESNGTLHDRSVEIDEGGPCDLRHIVDRDNRSSDFTYKEYLEAQ